MFKSSFDATKVIDCHIDEFIDKKQLEQASSIKSKNITFSGVDHDLDNIYQFLELIGNNKMDNTSFNPSAMPFHLIQKQLLEKGKSLQILSSKQVASLLGRNAPVKREMYAQTDEYQAEIELEKAKIEIFELTEAIEKHEKREVFLESTIDHINKDKVQLKGDILDLSSSLSKINAQHTLLNEKLGMIVNYLYIL